MKMLVPFGAALLSLQGVAEMLRCVVCLRENAWPPRLHDVEELELQLIEKHARRGPQGADGAAGNAS